MVIRLGKVFLLLYHLLILSKNHNPANLQLFKPLHKGRKNQETRLKYSMCFIKCCHLDIHWFGVFAARSGAAGNTIGEKKKEKNRCKV